MTSARNLAIVAFEFALCFVCISCNQSKKASQTSEVADAASPSHQLRQVVIGGKHGYIDETGKLVINPQWDIAHPFTEGLAGVCIGECGGDHFLGYRWTKDFRQEYVEQNFKYGFIDESGKLVINPSFENVSSFSEGLAAVCVGRGCYFGTQNEGKGRKWGYIDKQGTMVITPQFDDGDSFKEGLASVSVGGKHGYIDRGGKFVINPQFDTALDFEKGLAQVGVKGAEKDAPYKFGYIDKTGKVIWQPSN